MDDKATESPDTNPARQLPANRSDVLSEQRNPRTVDLHRLNVDDLVTRIQEEDSTIHRAVAAARPAISAFVSAAEPGFRADGRLIYFGAGTSGRLGVLDASEAPPTFHVPHDKVIGIIAGGDSSLRRSSEGKEDDPQGAIASLQSLDLSAHDSVIGIAAGGTTPYVRGGLAWCAARPHPPTTALLSCSPCPAPDGVGHLICAPTGPEVLTGSTRMKAGTATKLILNTISTALMVRSGRVYENLMVDVKATNDKLRDRAARIISSLTGLDRAAAFDVLEQADGQVKCAILMHSCAIDRSAAEQRLHRAHGRLGQALHQSESTPA